MDGLLGLVWGKNVVVVSVIGLVLAIALSTLFGAASCMMSPFGLPPGSKSGRISSDFWGWDKKIPLVERLLVFSYSWDLEAP